METTPDLSFFFAIHRKMRSDTARYARAVETATENDRTGRLASLARWARGFVYELEEHHYVEDTYFFPDLRARVPSAAAVLDRLEGDHRSLDGILDRWPRVSQQLAGVGDFATAKHEALELAAGLRDLLLEHLDVEDSDVLPLFWRHYTAAEYGVVYERAVKGGKKRGLGFVVPWNVDCVDGEERAALLAVAPLPLRLLWRATRGRHYRLVASAFEGVTPVTAVASP